MKFLTMKFGGTSVGDVARIKAVSDTIRSALRPNRKIIVVAGSMKFVIVFVLQLVLAEM